jgi:hypothetical protein
MFTRLAKSGLARLWPIQPGRIAPIPREAGLHRPYSNDNLPGFRLPAGTGTRRSPTPALACHWVDRNGRLECCWHPVTGDAPAGGFDEEHPLPGRVVGRPPVRSRCLALVA